MEELVLILVLAIFCGGGAYGKEKYRNTSRTLATTTSNQPQPQELDADSDQSPLDSHLHQTHPGNLGLGPPGALPRHGGVFPTTNGILDKSAPDLQFGLALTIPFVSLATNKLLHNLNTPGARSFRSWSDLAHLLKLNVGGLVLAAVVGVGALLLLPTVFHGRGGVLKGFGSNLFDNLIQNGIGGGVNKHFGYGQYEHTTTGGGYDAYNNNNGGGWANKYGGYGRKDSRDLKEPGENGTESSIWNTITTTVARNLPELSECSLYAACVHGASAVGFNSSDLGATSAAAAHLLGVGGLGEYAERLEEAYKAGRGSTDSSPSSAEANCAKMYSRCDKIPKFIDRVGAYIFGE